MTAQIVKCEVIDPGLRAKSQYIQLEIGKARRLAAKNPPVLRIIDSVIGAEPAVMRQTVPAAAGTAQPYYIERGKYALRRGKVRVAWIQDFSKMGGAELSNCRVVEIGERCGYDIVGITPGRFSIALLDAADIAVVNNFHEFTSEQVRTIMFHLIERDIPYIKYEHDYRELKRTMFARGLFNRAVGCVFLSPVHRQTMCERLGLDERHTATLPLAIDPDALLADNTNGHERASVFVPCLRKGHREMTTYMREHTDREYFVIGDTGQLRGHKNVHQLAPLKYDAMIERFRRHAEVLHLPERPWAGERVYLEARLAGCTVIANDNVGHVSWNFTDEELPEVLRQAPYEFWKEVYQWTGR
jgi:hypothetical protein